MPIIFAGNAAIYFDPLDADSVARAMAGVMEDSGLRQILVENGRRMLAQAPTWDEIADRFVEVLERTAHGEPPVHSESEYETENRYAPVLSDREMRGMLASVRPLPGPNVNSRRFQPADSLREKGSLEAAVAYDVRIRFNQKARRWWSKYGPKGKLNSRVEQFTARLAELCPPPANILDLGFGTGEIAAAIDQMGYQVTACDLAEEMNDIARHSYSGTAVKWVCLDPGREALPFADGSFDGVVASGVFEYLNDVQGMAAELARVLRPEGIMLFTVPNPCNVVRKLEAWLRSMRLHHRLSPVLRKVQWLDSYAAYLRLSRNRFAEQQWQSVLNAAHFAALDERDFSRDAWQHQAKASLVLLAVKRVVEQLDVEAALQHQGFVT